MNAVKAALELDVDNVEAVHNAVGPSLRSTSTVSYDVHADDMLNIAVETEKLGSLRGAVNTTLMLVKLSDTILTED